MKIINPGRVIWLAIFLLATITSEQLLAQPNLKKLEYAFDGDPGIGNATVINLPATPNIDDVFSFDASALGNGIHILRYRIMDVNNRWSLTQTLSFLKLGGNSTGTLTLKKLEYAFDTDPGFGNGTAINMLATQIVDSTFTIDVSNLSNGIHKIFYRVQDNDNKWSLTQTASILKFSGDNNGSNIVKAEYFLDTDPGFGNGTVLPVKRGNNITDTFSFVIPDNGKDKRMLYIRTQDNSGAWSLYYSQLVDVDRCSGKTEADFVVVRYGDRYAFVDSSKNNMEKKYLWNFDGLGTDSVANPTFDFPRGNHKITLITGEGCRKDTVEKTLYTTLENYYPNKGLRGTDLAMRFFGGSLDTNVTVELRKGATVLTPYKRLSKDFKQLVAFFDLHTAEGGSYNVRLKYKDGFDTTIINGLVIDANFTEPEIQVSLDGPALLRRNNEWTYYTLTVSNKSNSLAKGVPFWITIPNDVEYAIDSKILAPKGFQGYPIADSLPQYVPIDSIGGTTTAGRMYYIIAPYINANENFVFRFRLRSPKLSSQFSIYYGTDLPLFGSPLKYFWGDCFDDILFLSINGLGLAGAFPTGTLSEVVALALDGFSAFGDLMVDNSVDLLNGEFSGYSFMQTVGNAILSATGLAAVKRASDLASASGKVIKIAGQGTGFGNNLNNLTTSTGTDCWKSQDKLKKIPQSLKKLLLRVNNALDPNQITGPIGSGDVHYVNGKEKSSYVIEFENLATAGAAAQKAFVSDTLDKTKYDLSLFELGSFRIADSFYTVPADRKSYTTTIDMRPKLNMLVRFTASIDTATGIISYSFLSLDPASKGNIDENSPDGFLPPNTTYPRGSGSVSFSVPFKASLAHNDVVANRASIVFDKSAPLMTNTWSNKMDKVEPVVILPLSKLRNDTTMVLKFNGTDNGSGIQYYGVLYNINGGQIRYLGGIYTDSLILTGKYDSSYRFYIMPVDNVSNVGDSAGISFKLLLQQTLQAGNMLVFPNPGNGKFTVRLGVPEQQEITVDVYAATGQLLGTIYKSTVAGPVAITPDISRLSNGLYILRARGSKGLKMQTKIIIQH
jgi:hypothetical protein